MKNLLIVAVLLFSLVVHADPSGPPTKVELADTIKTLKAKPELKSYFSSSVAYAIFPRVGRGALGVGGAFGEGGVFKGGKQIGKTSLQQITIGFGAGGEQYTEVMFFKDEAAFKRFIEGNIELDAHATAVAANTGVGAAVAYNNGVAIMTYTKVGLMANAAIGGQRFTYDKL